MVVEVCDIPTWVEANLPEFRPPICNKSVFTDQLKVFFVGGPNQRADFHLEAGEELFYQITGDMCLRVVDRQSGAGGVQRDIPIREGEIFLLPARVEHSPQRFASTVGCVIERERAPHEFDCVRYFTDATSGELLWQKWFHLEDVVKDLPPVIREFRESEEGKTGKKLISSSGEPSTPSTLPKEAFEPDSSAKWETPLNLNAYIDAHLGEIESATNGGAPYALYSPPKYRSRVLLYGRGKHLLRSPASGDLVLLLQRGTATLRWDGGGAGGEGCAELKAMHMARMRPGMEFELKVDEGAVALTVEMLGGDA